MVREVGAALSPELGQGDQQEAQHRVQLRLTAGRQQPIEALAEQLVLRQAEAGARLEGLGHAFQIGAEGPPEGKSARDLGGLIVELLGCLIKGGRQPAGLSANVQTSLLKDKLTKSDKSDALY